MGWIVALGAFLATRLPFLDRDLPPWDLAAYQPIDESAYTIPAFNLHHYGTWTHLETPWTPLEGSPMNVLQSLVTSWTLDLDWSYWGFRASSILFGLVAFLALLAIVRTMVRRAIDDGVALPIPPAWVLAGAALLLLADFSFLLGSRVVEATIARLAELSVLLWLVSRGWLRPHPHAGLRLAILGLLAGAAVGFGYIYNAFLLPGVLLLVAASSAWSGPRREPARVIVRNVAIAAIGMAVAVAAYFVWVDWVYGQTPVEWRQTWLATYEAAGRATSIDVTATWDLLAGNVFRLDRPLMALTLLALPVFVRWAVRSRDTLAVAVLALGLAFALQCTVQSDYPQRKMLILLAFAVPMAVGGILRLPEFLDWLAGHRARRVLAGAWALAVVAGTVVLVAPPRLTHWSQLVRLLGVPPASGIAYRVGGAEVLIALGALAGLAALLICIAGWRRPGIVRAAALVLGVAILGPLIALDVRHVYTNVTTTYRDAMASVATLPDASVIAGGGSHAMQLYNRSRAVLQGNVFGMTVPEYEAAVVRYFREGRARWMFAYADGAGLARWTALGFRLAETYPIPLPKGRVMGRYEFTGNPPEP